MYVECSMQSDNIPHNTIQSNHNVCYSSTISLMQSSLTINHCQLYCKEHLDQHSIAYINPNTTIIRKKCSAYGCPIYNKLLNTVFPEKNNYFSFKDQWKQAINVIGCLWYQNSCHNFTPTPHCLTEKPNQPVMDLTVSAETSVWLSPSINQTIRLILFS